VVELVAVVDVVAVTPGLVVVVANVVDVVVVGAEVVEVVVVGGGHGAVKVVADRVDATGPLPLSQYAATTWLPGPVALNVAVPL